MFSVIGHPSRRHEERLCYCCVPTYNKLPREIREEPSMNVFKITFSIKFHGDDLADKIYLIY